MTRYSDETRAAVVAALLAGQSVCDVAREYSIPKGTVSSWKTRQNGCADVCTSATQKKEIGELLLEYLRANLEALRAQAEHFKNVEWLRKQSAENAAVLHGVMTDKAIRLLEAFGRAEDDSD